MTYFSNFLLVLSSQGLFESPDSLVFDILAIQSQQRDAARVIDWWRSFLRSRKCLAYTKSAKIPRNNIHARYPRFAFGAV